MKLHAYRGLRALRMDLEVQQDEKRATRRFALRLPVSVSPIGEGLASLTAQTRDVSARGICFYLDTPMSTGSAIEFTLTLPQKLPLPKAFEYVARGRLSASMMDLWMRKSQLLRSSTSTSFSPNRKLLVVLIGTESRRLVGPLISSRTQISYYAAY